ncbi:MAG: hypothetical protein L0Y66_04965 [Myxococcaceae bacterium]|nr:hypothetical protein [Myxococcaceae bacterium]MCI0672667.1 hypothetical protein [Myxococcaceae bacterium]
MTAGTRFAGARTATIDAAHALHGGGSAESSAVAQRWTLVAMN